MIVFSLFLLCIAYVCAHTHTKKKKKKKKKRKEKKEKDIFKWFQSVWKAKISDI